MKEHFRLSSEIYDFFEKIFHPWQEFLKKAICPEAFFHIRDQCAGGFPRQGAIEFSCIFIQKMLFSQSGERPAAQSLLICSNDNIMQMKDLNVRPPLRAFCPLNPLADARERGKRKKEGKEMRGFEIRCQSGSSIYNALNHFSSSKRLSPNSII